MTAAGHSNEAMRKIVSNCTEIVAASTLDFQ